MLSNFSNHINFLLYHLIIDYYCLILLLLFWIIYSNYIQNLKTLLILLFHFEIICNNYHIFYYVHLFNFINILFIMLSFCIHLICSLTCPWSLNSFILSIKSILFDHLFNNFVFNFPSFSYLIIVNFHIFIVYFHLFLLFAIIFFIHNLFWLAFIVFVIMP